MASNPLDKLAISPLLCRTRHPNNHRYRPLLALRLSSPHISSVRPYSKPITATAVAQASAASGDKPRKGSDVLVEALEREGVKVVFAYPGGASMDIHQALNHSPTIRNVFSRQERGGIFAAEGYARASGLPGVCIATSGSATANFVSGLAHAMIDSVPIVAITGQDPSLETLIVEVTRSITKHIFLVQDVGDIASVVREAFFLASSGRPGPILINIPIDIQKQWVVPNWDQPMRSPRANFPREPQETHFEQIVRLISESKKPVLYVGDGWRNPSEELRRFVEVTGIPVAITLTGVWGYTVSDSTSPGMNGIVFGNYAVDSSDLLLAFGVSCDDRVAGMLEAFASRAKIVHIDVDPFEVGKSKQPDVSVCADVKSALRVLNNVLEGKKGKFYTLDFSEWRMELEEQYMQRQVPFLSSGDVIHPKYAICEVLDTLMKRNRHRNVIVITGSGQHRMWAAHQYDYDWSGQWLTSGGFGAVDFGLPAAMGAAVGRFDSVVVDIEDDASFIVNVNDLATIRQENLAVKIIVFNNQNLGKFPNILKFAEAYEIPALRVTKKDDLRAAIQHMLDTPGPFLLDVIAPALEEEMVSLPMT